MGRAESDRAEARRASRSGARRFRTPWLLVAAVVVALALVATTSPWPAAMVVRWAYASGADLARADMQKHVPKDADIDRELDVAYGPGDDEHMDVYRPASASGKSPVVVWVHGGAWVSGSEDDVGPYLQKLAADGYAAVGVNYTLGPEASYPTAIQQVNAALRHLSEHADRYGIDPSRVVLAGDSAGAQMASQVAVLISNAHYAHFTGMTPGLTPDQLDGVILDSGVYDMDAMAEITGPDGWSLKSALWAYTGTKRWSQVASGTLMSTRQWVTEDFPPTFISGGNGDGLTWVQSLPMSETLRDENVPVQEEFFRADHRPALPHEYQFHLDLPEARHTYAATVAFLDRVTDGS